MCVCLAGFIDGPVVSQSCVIHRKGEHLNPRRSPHLSAARWSTVHSDGVPALSPCVLHPRRGSSANSPSRAWCLMVLDDGVSAALWVRSRSGCRRAGLLSRCRSLVGWCPIGSRFSPDYWWFSLHLSLLSPRRRHFTSPIRGIFYSFFYPSVEGAGLNPNHQATS